VTLNLVLLAAYALLLLAVGVRAAGMVRTVEDYLLAGRRSTGLDTGGSLAATILGASATLGLAGLAFRRGLTGSWWLLAGAVGLGVLYFLAAAARAHSVYSLPDLLGRWYGPAMRTVASAFIFVAWLGVVGAQMNAAGRILAAFLGGSTVLWVLLSGAVFIVYTALGGQLSVIRTDLYQLGFIVAGVTGCAVVGLKAAHGFAGLRQALPPGFFAFPLSPGFALPDLSLLLLVVGSTYLTGPDMLSRLFCSQDLRTARRGILLSIAVIVPAALLIALIGMVARTLFPGAAPESAFPLLMKHSLPPLLAALVMLALLSAFLSSADTTLMTMTTVLAVDLLRLPAAADTRRGLRALRGVTLLCGVGALAIGLFSGGIIPSLLLSYTIFSGGLFVPVLAGLLDKPMRGRAAIAAALAGGALALAGKLLGSDRLIASGFAAALLVFLADRLLLRRRTSKTGSTGL
jgi:SSS family solute:Na+ symporter